jgi:hypothetical protein
MGWAGAQISVETLGMVVFLNRFGIPSAGNRAFAPGRRPGGDCVAARGCRRIRASRLDAAALRALSGLEVVLDGDPPCCKFDQELGHRWRYLSVTRYDHCPFQILPELSGDDMPPIERRRCGRSDLNQGPVSNEFVCGLPAWQRTADDEMIVAMNQNADHPAYAKNSSRFSMHSLRFSELRLFKRARPALNTAREDSPSFTRLSRSFRGRMR